MAKKYPIGIQSFEKLRRDGYVYVDKTELIWNLAQNSNCYFLGRPRRFGKSLLISTLESYFLGQKDLFKGLAIEQLEKDWTQYPVFHLDLNAQSYQEEKDLLSILNEFVCKQEDIYGREESEEGPARRFAGVIARACEMTGRQAVILVDEYDKPLVQAIGNEKLDEEYRTILKGFYGVLKSCDRYIRFALLTGVSRFSHVSIFSDLNNLQDISMLPAYASICGISEQEMIDNFPEEINALARQNSVSYDEALGQLRKMYDGYHFVENSEGLYNPFSLLQALSTLRLGSYWYASGTPTILLKALQNSDFPLEDLSGYEATQATLMGGDDYETSPISLLYQTGYLTIKDYDREMRLYTLDFPNQEVEEGFLQYLLPKYAHIDSKGTGFAISSFVKDVRAGNVEGFMTRLKSFYADVPYELTSDLERHYHNVLFILTKLLGFYVEAEKHNAQGRIDLVIKTKKYIYIIELKLDGTAEQALAQINEKHYADPYKSDGRQVIKVGANFNSEQRNIERWLVE